MNEYIHQIIKYFFSHEVSGELRNRVHRRMADGGDAPECDKAMREVWDSLDLAAMPDSDVAHAYDNLNRTLFGSVRKSPSHRWFRIAAIWFLPVLMVSGSLYYFLSARRDRMQQEEVAFVQKFAANGQRALVVLPDSTRVWLNGGSVLIYPSKFIACDRNVCLSGEAFFDVTKDASRPFVVDVNHVRITVLGTTFNLSSYPDSPEVTATLATGNISANVEGNPQTYVLSPDDQFVYNRETGKVSIGHVKAGQFSVWRTGELYFSDTPFLEVMSQLERAFNVKIHIMNTRHNNQRVHAHFNSNYTIKEVMDIIKILVPGLSYKESNREIFIN